MERGLTNAIGITDEEKMLHPISISWELGNWHRTLRFCSFNQDDSPWMNPPPPPHKLQELFKLKNQKTHTGFDLCRFSWREDINMGVFSRGLHFKFLLFTLTKTSLARAMHTCVGFLQILVKQGLFVFLGESDNHGIDSAPYHVAAGAQDDIFSNISAGTHGCRIF